VNYILDTTAFSALMRRDDQMRVRMSSLSGVDLVAICTITRGEVLYGLERLPEGKRRQDLQAEATTLFNRLACLPVAERVGDRYAQIKRETERKGTSLDENDLWIAATVLISDGVLVTQDSDFSRVDGLRVENWIQ